MYDVIMHELPLEDCVEPTSVRNLFVAPASLDLAGAEIELVPAFSRELRLQRALEVVKDDYDFVLIDCPPSLGLLTVNGLAAATEVLVPIQCEYYALEGLGQLLRNVDLVRRSLNPTLEVTTIVLVMYDARTKLSDQVVPEVREHFGEKVCRTIVPRTVRLSEAPSFGQPIIAFDPSSRGAIAYGELAGRSATWPGGQRWHGAAGSARASASLIPPASTEADDGEVALREIPLTAIEPNPGQPRTQFDEESLGELTASIRELGVLQPILVRAVAAGLFQLIAGERRWRAARRAGLATIPAIVRTDRRPRPGRAGARREPPPPGPHRTRGGGRLPAADRGLRPDPRRGRHPGRQEPRRRSPTPCACCSCPPAIQRFVAEGQLTAGHARALLGTPDRAFQEELARQAVAEHWSVRAVEDAVRDRSGAARRRRRRRHGHPPVPTLRPPGLLELEELLSEYLNTRVSITMRGAKGQVAVEFATLEDLERIYRLMTEGDEHQFE